MDWLEENNKDALMLSGMGLEALNAEALLLEGDLLADSLANHAKVEDLFKRFNRLAADRRRLVDFDAWAHKDAASFRAERSRLLAEGWDVLWELQYILQERESLLGRVKNALEDRAAELTSQREKVVEAVRRGMSKIHKEYVRASPYGGEGHFNELVENSDEVNAVDDRLGPARRALESAAYAKHGMGAKYTRLTNRQQEVFRLMLSCGW
ncbi:MAG: hypothetical protein ACE15C_14810 [Phycisphaerae bacterium]